MRGYHTRTILLSSLIFLTTSCQPQRQQDLTQTSVPSVRTNKGDVIYGEDDRRDLFQVKNQKVRHLAASTVALVEGVSLQKSQKPGHFDVHGKLFGKSMSLCKDEPFYAQESGAFCSGFLVQPDVIVTAGHCVEKEEDCSGIKFIFDYALFEEGVLPKELPDNDIYGCKKLIHSEITDDGADFAVVQLDRPVKDRLPLVLRQEGDISLQTPLFVIGHPAGLPTKVAGGANVREVKDSFFVANLDTYGGNSGSSVFNATTGEIEGILVRGETDFYYRNACRASLLCKDDTCRGEDATKITQVLKYLPEPPPPEETLEFYAAANQAIPDHSRQGILVPIKVTEGPKGRRILVSVNVTHPYRGDVRLSLIDPSGREVLLKASTLGDEQANVVGTYGIDMEPSEDLTPLSKFQKSGTWYLRAADTFRRETGMLVDWKLIFEGTQQPYLPSEKFAAESSEVKIPDGTPEGVLTPLKVATAPHGRKVEVTLDVKHTYRGDLKIILIAPNGKEFLLKDPDESDNGENVKGTFGVDLPAKESLEELSQGTEPGEWSLKLIDTQNGNTGILKSWSIEFKARNYRVTEV